MIDAESEYIAENIGCFDEMKTARQNGELTGEEYDAYLGKYNYAVYC